MIDFKTIIWLLPLIFMLHDFEEIIFFKSWITKNREELSTRFPKLAKRFLARFEKVSVQGFTIAVAEEFVLLSVITVTAILFESYLLWLGVFMGFFIHLLVHLFQWIILRRYIPAIYTTVISLVYCFFAMNFILKNNLFEIKEIVIWSFIGFGVMAVNLIFAHKLGERFEEK